MDDDGLKLAAMDADDLAVLSAHLQDAVLKRSDMRFVAGRHRFGLVCNRFDWLDAARNENGGWRGRIGRLFGRAPRYRRRRASLVVDHVVEAAQTGFTSADPDAVLNLLSVAFSPLEGSEDGLEAPEHARGHVILTFAGGGRVRLAVDCVEARLADEGPAWATRARPRHSAAASR